MVLASWLFFVIAANPSGIEPVHAANPVLREVLEPSFRLDGIAISPRFPILTDDMAAEEETAAMIARVGSVSRLEEMLKDSISAPTVLKLSDLKTANEAILRVGELSFGIHADLVAIDADQIAHDGEKTVVEAANLRFETRNLPKLSLERHTIELAKGRDGKPTEWYVHLDGRLLDRIAVEATSRTYLTRSDRSLVVASRTLTRFESDPEFSNHWAKIVGNKREPWQSYAGGFSLLKMSQLTSKPGVLFVEVLFAFDEPKGWFGGEPVLRSKIGLATQDQIRGLRRELAKRKMRPRGNP